MGDFKNINIFLKWLIIILLLAIFIFLIIYQNNFNLNVEKKNPNLIYQIEPSIKYVKIAGKNIKVDLATSKEAQAQGLSGRISLKEDEGMLFIFDNEDKYPFWMKGMNFPIDIIWIDNTLKVIYIKRNALPESYPDTFTPSLPAKYVLELNSLFSEKNNLKVGDMVEFLSL